MWLVLLLTAHKQVTVLPGKLAVHSVPVGFLVLAAVLWAVVGRFGLGGFWVQAAGAVVFPPAKWLGRLVASGG